MQFQLYISYFISGPGPGKYNWRSTPSWSSGSAVRVLDHVVTTVRDQVGDVNIRLDCPDDPHAEQIAHVYWLNVSK